MQLKTKASKNVKLRSSFKDFKNSSHEHAIEIIIAMK